MQLLRIETIIVLTGLLSAGTATTLHAQSRARANPTAARHLNTQRALPSNYGSLNRSAPTTSYSYEGNAGTVNYQRQADGSMVNVVTTPAGQVGVSGNTADGEKFRGSSGVNAVRQVPQTKPMPRDGTQPRAELNQTTAPQRPGRVESVANVNMAGGGDAAVIKTENGNVYLRERNDGRAMVRDLDDDYRQINIGGSDYYYRNHRYYWPYYYGGSVYYHEVYPPEGATEEELPDGATQTMVRGNEYYVYDDVYYRSEGDQYVVEAPASGPGKFKPPPPEPVDPIELLTAMSSHLAEHDTFSVSTTEFYDSPRGDGTYKAVMPQRQITARRPDRMTATRRDGFDTRKFWYDGKSATFLDESKKVYSTIDAPDSIPGMLEMLRDDYGVTLPLADFLRHDFVETLQPLLMKASYNGWENVVGHDSHRLVLETAEVKGRIWIDANPEAPLLRRVSLHYFTYPGNPEYTVTLNKWELGEFAGDALFAFSAPKGTKKIEMIPLLPGSPKDEVQ